MIENIVRLMKNRHVCIFAFRTQRKALNHDMCVNKKSVEYYIKIESSFLESMKYIFQNIFVHDAFI